MFVTAGSSVSMVGTCASFNRGGSWWRASHKSWRNGMLIKFDGVIPKLAHAIGIRELTTPEITFLEARIRSATGELPQLLELSGR